MSKGWDASQVSDLVDRTFVVTGANSGLGFETTRALAAKGAHVVMACRSRDKTEPVMAAIVAELPKASLEFIALDLASLESVESFCDAFKSKHDRLDVLCNNAGVMALPYRKTADGFEMQIGTNHFGHFALTGRLLDLLLKTQGSRVVNVASMAHKWGKMNFDDLQSERSYQKWVAYGQSKLANLLFTYELDRRLRRAGKETLSAAAHPGYSATNLQTAGANMTGAKLSGAMMRLMNKAFSQDASMGALPTLRAALAPDVKGGDYYGPSGFMESAGYPVKVRSNPRSKDEAVAKRLWEVSAELAGVGYDALDPPASLPPSGAG